MLKGLHRTTFHEVSALLAFSTVKCLKVVSVHLFLSLSASRWRWCRSKSEAAISVHFFGIVRYPKWCLTLKFPKLFYNKAEQTRLKVNSVLDHEPIHSAMFSSQFDFSQYYQNLSTINPKLCQIPKYFY